MDKTLVAKRFDGAKSTYKSNATVQLQMAEFLAEMSSRYVHKNLERVFELGCGTGFLTEAMLKFFNINHYCANDLVPEVNSVIESIIASEKVNCYSFYPGDMEEILFPQQLDMICSGAAIQWIKDLSAFFKKANDSLRSKGFLVFSTFGPENYTQIKKLTDCGIRYPDAIQIMKCASKYFEVIDFKEWQQQLQFSSPKKVLKHMQLTGVNGVAACKWTKSDMIRFMDGYEHLKANEEYPLTYHPILMILQKKD